MFKKTMNAVLLAIFTLGVCHSAVLRSANSAPGSINLLAAWRIDDVTPSNSGSSFKINPKINTIAAVKPSFRMNVRLQGKTQNFLQIASDGTINGTDTCASDYAEFELQSMRNGLLHIKSIETGLYIAMNSEGNLYSSNSANNETIFKQAMQSTSFHTFASAKFYRNAPYDSFISLGRNGKARNGKYTTSAQNKVKFLVFEADSC